MRVRCSGQLKANKPKQFNTFEKNIELAKFMLFVTIKHDPHSFANHVHQCLNHTGTFNGIVRKNTF